MERSPVRRWANKLFMAGLLGASALVVDIIPTQEKEEILDLNDKATITALELRRILSDSKCTAPSDSNKDKDDSAYARYLRFHHDKTSSTVSFSTPPECTSLTLAVDFKLEDK